jgi:hypothetical protein
MFGWHYTVNPALHRGLDAVRQELRALEQDLGLCARCGESRPRSLSQRRFDRLRARSWPAAGRRAA